MTTQLQLINIIIITIITIYIKIHTKTAPTRSSLTTILKEHIIDIS